MKLGIETTEHFTVVTFNCLFTKVLPVNNKIRGLCFLKIPRKLNDNQSYPCYSKGFSNSYEGIEKENSTLRFYVALQAFIKIKSGLGFQMSRWLQQIWSIYQYSFENNCNPMDILRIQPG